MKTLIITFLSIVATSYFAFAGEAKHGEKPAGKHRDNRALYPQFKPDTSQSVMPTAVKLVGPDFLADVSTSAELKWEATSGEDTFHVQVASDPNFKWLVKEENPIKATSISVGGLEAGKRYYWRVAALRPKNWTTSSKGPFTQSAFVVK